MREPSFTIGVEEEYLLIDRETGNLIDKAPSDLVAECSKVLPEQVQPELLQSQIEIGTRVCTSMAQVRAELVTLRSCVSKVAEDHGLSIIAASMHPWSSWRTQHYTAMPRYTMLAEAMQALMQRMTICGAHVHVAVEDDAVRIDLLNQVAYIVPHLLALSTSSPYHEAHDTGLKSFRVALYKELPRTGLPPHFDSEAEYHRVVDLLVRTEIIESPSRIWWDVRPSERFPTLEMRVADMCPFLDDTVTIAAIYRCWLRMLWRLKHHNQRWRRYSNFLIDQNRWLAMRYGMDRGLIDFGQGEIVPYADLLEELLSLIAPDAEHFGCVAEVEHARTIVKRGTSADRQRAAYAEASARGLTHEEALREVVAQLQTETLSSI
jgi:carboxylate-amine ligase